MLRNKSPIAMFARTIELPPDRGGKPWKPFQLFGRKTRNARINSHYSVLAPGECPHPPHIHPDEEILLVLDGHATILLAENPEDPAPRAFAMERGQFAYYPYGQHHTIRNDSDGDITYLMFRWSSRRRANGLRRFIARHYRSGAKMKTGRFDVRPHLGGGGGADGIFHSGVFNSRTGWLRRLKCHLTRVDPGAGYGSHADKHDVAILLLEGQIETNGERLADSGIAFFPAGVEHDMHNTGDMPATYLVFEFHRRKWKD